MGDISKGFGFSGNSPNNAVTAANLNNLVDQAAILPSLISGKPAKLSPVAADQLLLWDSVTQTLQRVTVQRLVPQFATRASTTGLKIATNGANLQLQISATQILMQSATGAPRVVNSFSMNLDPFGVVGAGGRDVPGSFSGNTWFYVFAISDGVTDSVLASSSNSGPTLPLGYIYKCLLGAWRIPNSGTTLVPGLQLGTTVNIDIGADAADATTTNQVPFIGGVPFSAQAIHSPKNILTAVDVSCCIPPGIVRRVRGIIGTAGGSPGTTAVAYAIAPNADASTHTMTGTGANLISPNYGVTMLQVPATSAVGTDSFMGFVAWAPFEVTPNPTATQTIYAACDNTAARNSMRITGYDLNL